METIGDRLRHARSRGDYSIRALARALREEHGLELKHGTVSHYETGRSLPRADYLLGLCKLTSTNPTWVLAGELPIEWERRRERRRLLASVADYMEAESERIRQTLRENPDQPIPEEIMPTLPLEALGGSSDTGEDGSNGDGEKAAS